MIGPYSEKGDTSEALAKGSTAADRGRAPGHRDRPRRRHCVGGHTNVPALNRGDSALTGSHRAAAQSTPSTDPPASTTSTSSAGTDPFGAATAQFLSGRAGTIAAAAYDIDTRQSWDLGGNEPQERSKHREGRHFGDASCPVRRPGTLNGRPGRSAGHDRKQRQRLSHRPVERRRECCRDRVIQCLGRTHRHDTIALRAVRRLPVAGMGLTKTVAMDQITLLRTIVRPKSL